MSSNVIVVISDLDNASHGEINVLNSPEEASRLVETLIESGYDQTRVRAFACEEFDIHVHHQPIVSLAIAEDESQSEPGAEDSEEADQKEEPVVAGDKKKPALAATRGPEPFTRDGLRFSAQFGPA